MKGLYVHLPFCRRRCSYCPFAISVDRRLEERYFGALLGEVSAIESLDDLATIYLGGGTPSLSATPDIARILATVPEVENISELTLEANPEDVDAAKVRQWRELGVSRLSIGVQSLHDDELRPLGRLHGPDRAIESIDLSTGYGFRTSADLIIGLPGQTRSRFRASLDGVLEAGVGHISLYVLDLDEETPLRRRVEKGRVTLPDEDLVADLYLEAVDRCGAFGLEQYEISNFSRPGEESIHNLLYWTRETYRGIGLAAHSFDGRRRFANVVDLGDYIERSEKGESTVGFEEVIGPAEAMEEEIFLALRRSSGIEVSRLTELRGETAADWIERGTAAGAIVVHGNRVAFTPRGFLVSNELIADLF